MELDKVTIQDHHEPDSGSEAVVISHPNLTQPTHYNSTIPRHPHDGREVMCKKGATEITLEPMYDHDKRHTYKRTKDQDHLGRPIFTEAK